MTGKEYLESIRDNREVWIYGKRVEDVTEHPAFRNSARMIARLYDALHSVAEGSCLSSPTDTKSGGYTHPFFKVPRSVQDLVAARNAIVEWQRIVYGWMGRTPDYKASFTATLGALPEFYSPFEKNALEWYRRCQEQVLFLSHSIVNPPVDRNRPPEMVGDVIVHAVKDNDSGVVVSGAKVVATGAALTHFNFVAHAGFPLNKRSFALAFIAPISTPGVKLICRPSYELTGATVGSPFDYPLSSRFDENDAVIVFDNALIPWENILIYQDVEKANSFLRSSGFTPRFIFHGTTRLAVKLDFLCGLLVKASELIGSNDARPLQSKLGEVMAWRNTFWGLSDAMAHVPTAWLPNAVLPNEDHAMAARVLATTAYPRVREIVEETVASALIFVTSHATDFQALELRPCLDRYLRGSLGTSAVDRVKLMKLLWDAIGTEFGSRQSLYERNYGGNFEDVRIQLFKSAAVRGRTDDYKEFVTKCMSEYGLDGWEAPDLINPTEPKPSHICST